MNDSQGKKNLNQLQMRKQKKKNARINNFKSKTIPLQAWIYPEDSRMLKLPDFKTIGT
jgi:hypothetical protein